jgi:hypothetical protein
MNRVHTYTLFDSCMITESVPSKKGKDRNIVRIGDDIAASLKEK